MLLAVLSILYLLFSVLTAGHALLNKSDSKSALGWIACCLLVPYLGAVLYLLFGINVTYLSARKKRPVPDDSGVMVRVSDHAVEPDFPLAVVGGNVTGKKLLPCREVRMLVNGDEAYPLMLQAIEGAVQNVWLSSYIFANDETGRRFVGALKAASDRGLDVRIILDGMGEMMCLPRIGSYLRKQGLNFRRFNPLTLVPPSLHVNMRNHRKLLVIDERVAFTGGMNISNQHYVQTPRADKQVQDVHFMLKGSIVSDMEYSFLKDWDYCGRSSDASAYRPKHPVEMPETQKRIWTRLILDGPNEYLSKFSDVLTGMISSARSRVWLMTPYFLPDSAVMGALQAAKLRNIDLKIVLTEENNIPPAHWATRNMLWQLLEHDIDIYYQPPPFVHSKLLIIDTDYSLIGSPNIDPRSLRLNFELAVEVFSAEINSRLEAHFLEKIGQAKKISNQELHQRSLPVRIRDAIAWLFTPYL